MNIEEELSVIDRALEANNSSAVLAMFSGGHDSLVATAIAAQHRAFTAAVHINTGIGIEATREFVRDTCKQHSWPLREIHADRIEQTYEYIVNKYGFPGPAGHSFVYRRLKERKIERLVKEQQQYRGDRIVLVTGMRADESIRRMHHGDLSADGPGWRRMRAKVWTNPIKQWSKSRVSDFISNQGLDRNQVVDLLHMSGECLCGAFARPGEIQELETWFPETAAYLHQLERQAEASGVVACVWGRRPDDVHPNQERMFDILPLCHSCQAKT